MIRTNRDLVTVVGLSKLSRLHDYLTLEVLLPLKTKVLQFCTLLEYLRKKREKEKTMADVKHERKREGETMVAHKHEGNVRNDSLSKKTM